MAASSLGATPVGTKTCLIIGYGNTLRRDDGLGPWIADHFGQMSGQGQPLWRAMALPQLDVTLVSELSGVDRVIFVDARDDDEADLVTVKTIAPANGPPGQPFSTHTLGILELLQIARDWFDSTPTCLMVMPKGFDFSIGESLSDSAQVSAALAIQTIAELLGGPES